MSETTTGVAAASPADDGVDTSRRDFLYLTTAATAAVGVAAVAWPFIDNLNPAADTLALSTVDVDLAPIAVGQAITVKWRGKPVFIRHRTEQEIAEAEAVEPSSLRDPQSDAERVFNPAYLVQIGICTHLGCVPLGQRPTDDKGDYNGWFCPCHGSHYDTSGRIRKGPAPLNLEIPQYMFRDETIIRLGEGEGPGAEA